MKIIAYRDFIISIIHVRKGMQPYEDDTPNGAPWTPKGGKGGELRKVIFGVNLYFIVPAALTGLDYQLKQEHVRTVFADELTKFNEGVFEYVRVGRSETNADESYYRDLVVKGLRGRHPSFAFEVNRFEDRKKGRIDYYGFYSMGSWRSKEGVSIKAPVVPYGFDVASLTRSVRNALYNE